MKKNGNLIIKSAIYFSFIFSLITVVIRGYGWYITNSFSILSILVDSIMDIVSSGVALIAAKYAFNPPDNEHRYGHEKIQDLAIFIQASFFCIFSLFILYLSIDGIIFHNHSIHSPKEGIYSLVFSSILNFVLVAYQSYVIKCSNSDLIRSERLHYSSDLIANIGAIVSVYFSETIPIVDNLFAIFISIYMIYNSLGLFKKSIKNLVDQELDDGEKQKILDIVESFKEIHSIHNFKTRNAANKVFVQIDIELDGNLSLFKAHKIADDLKNNIEDIFENAEVIIHQDPIGVEEKAC